ncbi:MAG: succinate dehydrogenase, cytochrome b556 subunit [Thiobacillaceae bacterium]|nr:succinate dehydrogenase, cytochrome b556 subunit [Thiobacillaceae bacterium]
MKRAAHVQFFQPWRLRLPLTGWVSILHRASGVLLVLALPVLLYLLQTSLASPQGYAQVRAWLSAPAAQLAALVLLWALLHHWLAGLRHLAMDAGLALTLAAARRTAAVTLWLALVLTLGGWLLV